MRAIFFLCPDQLSISIYPHRKMQATNPSAHEEPLSQRLIKYTAFYGLCFAGLYMLVTQMNANVVFLDREYHELGNILGLLILCATCGPSPFVIPIAIAVVYPFEAKHQFWENLVSTSEIHARISIPFFLMCFVYWANGLFLFAFDILTKNNSAIHNLKIQPEKSINWTPDVIRKVVLNILFNQFLVLPLLFLVYYAGPDYSKRLLCGWEIFRDILVCSLTDEFLFFHVHRILHLPSLYGNEIYVSEV
jgi:glycopeptide antibiotics resistance protein